MHHANPDRNRLTANDRRGGRDASLRARLAGAAGRLLGRSARNPYLPDGRAAIPEFRRRAEAIRDAQRRSYHSAMVDDLRPYCDARDRSHLDDSLSRFQPYDLCHKSYSHAPRIDMEKYRVLIEDLFPQPILF